VGGGVGQKLVELNQEGKKDKSKIKPRIQVVQKVTTGKQPTQKKGGWGIPMTGERAIGREKNVIVGNFQSGKTGDSKNEIKEKGGGGYNLWGG